jgi:rubrerythrin
MNEISQETLDAIKYATTIEITGQSFYEHAAELTHNEHGIKMFKKLAQDESGHIKTFSEMFTSVLGTDEWQQFINKEEINKTTLLDELKTRIKKQEEERASELEALRIGMELERKSIDYYKKSANESKDTKAKEIFNRLVKEEEFHYDLLQAQYDSLTGSGFWFDMAEFKMDGRF